MQAKADEYRAKSQECIESAASARHPEIKRQFEDLARQWWEMANQVERSGLDGAGTLPGRPGSFAIGELSTGGGGKPQR